VDVATYMLENTPIPLASSCTTSEAKDPYHKLFQVRCRGSIWTPPLSY